MIHYHHEYSNYRLRYMDREDLVFLYDLRMDRDTQKYLGTSIFMNMHTQEEWFTSVMSSNSNKYLIYEESVDNEWQKIGMVRLTDIDYVNRSVCVGGDIAKAERGRGKAKVMYSLILDLVFNSLNMHRAWLFVIDYNEIAISLYKKIGFVEEGRQREAIYRNGEYFDYIMMSLMRSDYKQ